MKTRFILLVFLALFAIGILPSAMAQTNWWHQNQYADAAIGVAEEQASLALSWVKYQQIDKKARLNVGLGLRWNSYFGTDQDFGYHAENPPIRETDFGVLTVPKAQLHGLNLGLFSELRPFARLRFGFNIDLIGFAFGSNQAAHNQELTLKPSNFSLLLGANKDKGTLNSEIYLGYGITERMNLRAGRSHFYFEYETSGDGLRYGGYRDLYFIALNYRLWDSKK